VRERQSGVGAGCACGEGRGGGGGVSEREGETRNAGWRHGLPRIAAECPVRRCGLACSAILTLTGRQDACTHRKRPTPTPADHKPWVTRRQCHKWSRRPSDSRQAPRWCAAGAVVVTTPARSRSAAAASTPAASAQPRKVHCPAGYAMCAGAAPCASATPCGCRLIAGNRRARRAW